MKTYSSLCSTLCSDSSVPLRATQQYDYTDVINFFIIIFNIKTNNIHLKYPNYHSLCFFSPLHLPYSTIYLVKQNEIIYVCCWIKKESTILLFIFIYPRDVR